ncbi:biliverdin-producing heme oxygenase [Roseibium aggregatum]|uniref:Biliverdin-producing heme oxygenase n=1 Tax=Roseibium aggregatum TaxID=187304 RepID=A0A939J2X7_9HYPH|nr:biliverdin-producing heme oxygenase [Roseibium aggregatum]MBN9670002.1 biliverdin-producing heme oxygenase [Roseibium aggregatum]
MTETTMALDPVEQPGRSRSERLKDETREVHGLLDRRISDAGAFDTLEGYKLFLDMQHRVHQAVDPYYLDDDLEELIPGLKQRRRLELIERDMADLDMNAPASLSPLVMPSPDPASAFGWLYVVEGSTLGAAVLLKRVKLLGLSADRGAAHLEGHPDGRGLHWRRFKSALDAAPFQREDEKRLTEAACTAFKFVRGLADDIFG